LSQTREHLPDVSVALLAYFHEVTLPGWFGTEMVTIYG